MKLQEDAISISKEEELAEFIKVNLECYIDHEQDQYITKIKDIADPSVSLNISEDLKIEDSFVDTIGEGYINL